MAFRFQTPKVTSYDLSITLASGVGILKLIITNHFNNALSSLSIGYVRDTILCILFNPMLRAILVDYH